MGRAVTIDLRTNDEQTRRALARLQGQLGNVDGSLDKTSKHGANLNRILGGLVVGAGIHEAISQIEEADVADRKLARSIAASGNAAHVSADEQKRYANELSKKIAVDNDEISLAATRLRAYQNIKDQRFYETLAVSADVAAAKEKDLSSVTDALGKALNNPLKAGRQLRTLGIELTASQTEQIKAFVAAGDAASAQGVILTELQHRYKGAAEANVTDSQRMKVAMGDAAESAGRVLAPAMTLAAGATSDAAGAFEHLPEPLRAAAIAGLGLAYVGPKIGKGLESARDSGSKFIGWISDVPGKTGPAVQGLTSMASTVAESPAAMAVGAAGVAVLTAALIEMAFSEDKAKKNAESLVEQAESSGKSLRELFDERLAKNIAGVKGGFDLGASGDRFGRTLKDAGISAEQLSQVLHGTDANFAAFKKQLLIKGKGSTVVAGLAADLDVLRGSSLKAAAQQKILTGAQLDLGVETDKTSSTAKGNAAATGDAAGATRSWTGATKDQIAALGEHLTALQNLDAETQTSIGLAGDAASAELALKGAHDSVQDAELALADARRNGSAEQQQRAEDALTDAVLREVQAADDLAKKEATAAGKHYDAGDSARVQRDRLAELRKETGLNNATLTTLAHRLDVAALTRKITLDTTEFDAAAKRVLETLARLSAIATTSQGVVDANGAPVKPGQYNADHLTGPKKNLGSVTVPVTVNVDHMHVGGTTKDMHKAMEQAGRHVARKIRIAS